MYGFIEKRLMCRAVAIVGLLSILQVGCGAEKESRTSSEENASKGTDHGSGSQMFFIGDSVKAGLIGKHPSLTDLFRGDLKHHTDFRSVYATVLRDWIGVASEGILGKKYPSIDLFAAKT